MNKLAKITGITMLSVGLLAACGNKDTSELNGEWANINSDFKDMVIKDNTIKYYEDDVRDIENETTCKIKVVDQETKKYHLDCEDHQYDIGVEEDGDIMSVLKYDEKDGYKTSQFLKVD
ncbi:hypothetical protein K0O13_08180 [Mammaliicoccus sciuri]|uniref:hypothetical protein n=1 Tax=Mammaliicoccus sciuri TaxID=1296 RepID=UPI001C639520|nr:hypothetical protein [Mammaliicoccus sciuri]QYG30078.1 hypothetical protein K0O13_08180 [Mammaliicoccus sciuri]